MIKIGAEIVTFNPDISKLEANVKNVVNQVDQVVLVDNGSDNLQDVKNLANDFNVEIVSLNQNKGIATALNSGMKHFRENGFTWVVTLDQDSLLPENAIINFKNTRQFNDRDTAILAAQYDDKNWDTTVRNQKLYDVDAMPIEKKIVITSGNMVKIDAWRKVGGFDEWLFIDQVDFEFNARLHLTGYKIWQVNSVVMSHEIGSAVKNGWLARMLLFKKNSALMQHSPFRVYYMQRNSLVYDKRYPTLRTRRWPLWFMGIVRLRPVLLSDTPWTGLAAGLKGMFDGMKYNPKNDEFMKRFWDSL